ncbi:insulinase family protein [Candidatus Dojkabacteria bacterium]|nr:insulinase family protein [Candidatus Dojkabacteria bacterium]
MKEQIQKSRLKNKLRVLLINKEGLQTTTIIFKTNVGSINEPQGKNGLCTLTHRMNLRGIKRIPDTYKLNLEIEKIGASLVSSSTKEITSFAITAQKQFLPQVIKLLAEVIETPIDKSEDLKKEKIILTSQIEELEDNPMEYALIKFTQQVYKDTKLENLSLGSIIHLKKIDIRDIRLFRKKYFNSEALITVSGDLENAKVLSLLEKNFAFKLNLYRPTKVKFKRPKQLLQFIRKEIAQPVFVLGGTAPNYTSKDYYHFLIGKMILGTGTGSKLHQTIREKLHLAYYAYSFFAPTGIIGMCGGISGVLGQKLKDAIYATREEIRKVSKGEFSQDEIERAKGLYEGMLIGFNESSTELASFYSNQLMYKGRIEKSRDILNNVKAVSKEDIALSFRKHLGKGMYLTLITHERENDLKWES